MASEQTRVIRYVLAFVLAPLTPAFVFLVASTVTHGTLPTWLAIKQLLIYSALLTYLPELILGLPALAVLLVLDRLDALSFAIAGAVVGFITLMVITGFEFRSTRLTLIALACVEMFAILSTLVFKMIGGWKPARLENGVA